MEVPEEVRGDPHRIRQIVENFVSNALKFTESGGKVCLTVEVKESHQSFVHLEFAVTDSGIGIPKSRLKMLFQPHTQSESSTARKYGGTGLGLSISHGLTSLMGGKLSAESSEGVRSRFSAIIPLRKGLPVGRDRLANKGVSIEIATEFPMKILIVDDNEVNLAILRRHLKCMGYNPSEATSGSGALQELVTAAYDLVFMDIHMPQMDGIEATERIVQLMQNSRPRICALTASTTKAEQVQCHAAGMDSYLTKPVSRAALIQEIERSYVALQKSSVVKV